MTYWERYKNLIYKNCLDELAEKQGISYFSNQLFAELLIYFFPFCTIAAMLGVAISLEHHIHSVALTDAIGWGIIAAICFVYKMNILVRKLLFIAVLYMVACSLFFNLGTLGPGMLYFLVCTIITILIFPRYSGYWSVAANTICCVLIGIIIHFRLFSSPIAQQYTLEAWIAVSVNIVMYSFLMVVIIPRLFYKLERSRSRYEAVATATSDTIWDWSLKKNTMIYNENLANTFGYTADKLDNTSGWWLSLIHPDDRTAIETRIQEAIQSAGRFSLEYRMRCSDNTYRHVLSRAIVLRQKDGQPDRIVGAVQDMTAIREYIAAIEKQNNRLKEIAWVQSHKVRGPVATLMGLAALVKEGVALETSREGQTILSGIVDSCQQLDNVIKEINDLAEGIELHAPDGLDK